MQASKALLLSNMLSSYESVKNAEIATFNASCVCTPDISVDLEPIQDMHGYDNPWPAGGGKNKVRYPYFDGNSVTINGVTFTVDEYGVITANGTATANAEYKIIQSTNVNLPAGNWTISGLPSGGITSYVFNFYGTDADGNIMFDYRTGTDKTVTATSDIKLLSIGLRVISGYTCNNLKVYPQFELGSSATSFAPYSNICPISGRSEVNVYVEESYDQQATPKATVQLGQTVYGGKLDVTSGKLVIDKGEFVADGQTSVSSVSYNQPTGLYFVAVTATIHGIYTDDTNMSVISDRFKTSKVVGIGNTYVTYNGLIIVAVLPDQTVTTKQLATEWFRNNPTTFVYELATPVEVTLTPAQIQTLVGENNIWSDSGNISVLNITCNADFLKTFLKMKSIGDC